MLNDNSEQRTANSGQRTEKSEQRTANSKQRTANSGQRTAISDDLRRRAKAIINDRSIDVETRAIIRYGLETSDLWLAQLVRRIEAGQTIIETIVVLKHPIDPRKNIVGK